MSDLLDDSRNRPLVFHTSAEPSSPRRRLRRPAGVLAGATLVVASLAGAAGLAFGGSAVWSVVGPKGGDAPAPLWLPPPPSVSQAASSRHDAPANPNSIHPTLPGHPEPGDADHNTAKSGRGGANSGKGGSGRGSSGSGSGRSPGGSSSGGGSSPTTHEATSTQGGPATNQEPEPGRDDNRSPGGSGSGSSGGSGSTSGGSGSGSSGGSSSGGSGSDDSSGGGSSGGGGRH